MWILWKVSGLLHYFKPSLVYVPYIKENYLWPVTWKRALCNFTRKHENVHTAPVQTNYKTEFYLVITFQCSDQFLIWKKHKTAQKVIFEMVILSHFWFKVTKGPFLHYRLHNLTMKSYYFPTSNNKPLFCLNTCHTFMWTFASRKWPNIDLQAIEN